MTIAQVLVAHDNPVTAALIHQAAATCGAHADIAFSGQEALHMVNQQHYDLVIMDIEMPPPGGVELIRRLRSGDWHVAILATASYAAVEVVARAIDAGADAYVSEPFLAKDLRAKMARLLERTARNLNEEELERDTEPLHPAIDDDGRPKKPWSE